jgi:hypothetical protein
MGYQMTLIFSPTEPERRKCEMCNGEMTIEADVCSYECASAWVELYLCVDEESSHNQPKGH